MVLNPCSFPDEKPIWTMIEDCIAIWFGTEDGLQSRTTIEGDILALAHFIVLPGVEDAADGGCHPRS